jgi:transposase InsO family protein
MDIVGQFPKTERDNKYILVVCDYFTRWTEAFPLPNQEAATVAQVFVNEYVCRYGVPEQLHTDQGRNFESKLIQEICELLQIHKTRISPYHPQADGLVERFNSTLEAMLSKYVNENQKNWDECLQLVMLAYRSSVQESTRQTPYFMTFGREVRLPLDIMFGGTESKESVNMYAEAVRNSLEKAYKDVRERMKVVQKRQREYYNERTSG